MSLDLRGALARLGNDVSLFEEFIGFYNEDCPRLLAALRAAVASEDPSGIHHSAHSLKGLVASLGAVEVMATTTALERIGRSGDLSEAGPALAKLEHEIAQLNDELATLPASLPMKLRDLTNIAPPRGQASA
jgi:HPt (histidine-containing phosphotransfer) domain-containing protein